MKFFPGRVTKSHFTLNSKPRAIPVTVKFTKLHPSAAPPLKMSPGSAGFDLIACEACAVPATRARADGSAEVGHLLVSTGIALALPPGHVGRVGSRSGLAVKHNVEAGAGWIDSDYRGELKVELKNFGAKPFDIRPGDRIAQLIILPVTGCEMEEVQTLDETSRGAGGFGSTGK